MDTPAPGSREERCNHAAEETDENIVLTMDDEIVNSICSLEKMEKAINEFLPFKTPEPDGIHPVLLQKGWKQHFPDVLEVHLCAKNMEGRD